MKGERCAKNWNGGVSTKHIREIMPEHAQKTHNSSHFVYYHAKDRRHPDHVPTSKRSCVSQIS